MRSMTERFDQAEYLRLGAAQSAHYNEFLKGLQTGDRDGFRKFSHRPNPRTDEALAKFEEQEAERYLRARQMVKHMMEARWGKGASNGEMAKAGISTSLGYNFYDLRAPVFLMYPVNTPLRNSIPAEGPINAGVGVAAHWKGTTNVGTQPISIPEGFRAPIGTPNEVDFLATYKEFGVDRGMTFTAQWAGEGLTDNLADDHLRGLQSLWLGEEGTILNGNNGSGTNGFALGTANTPTLAQSQTTPGTFTVGNTIGVACVFLTAMGYPSTNQYGYGASQTVTGGLTPSYTAVSAVGESYTMPGGTSAISAISSTLTISGSNNTVTATVTKKNGAFAFAWYVSTAATPALGNAYLYAITTSPSVTITAAAPSTRQNGAAANLNVDNSANSLEFSGLIPQVAWSAATSPWVNGSQWTDMAGASFTAAGHGAVKEIEDLLENAFLNWQTGYTDIWGSPDAIRALSAAIIASASAGTGAQIIMGPNNTMNGGNIVTGYVSRYAVDSPSGANVIPLRMHPMMPPGTLYFHIGKNPYPQSRIGNVLAALLQRDYYSIEWPVTSRDWTFGTYRQYVLAHRLPWIPAVITGIGPYTGL
jgi:hypothetical protein